MRILQAHGMAASIIHVIFNAVIVAKLTYAAIVYGGALRRPTIVSDCMETVVRRGIRSVADIVTEADDKLFSLILHYKNTTCYTACT